MPRGNAAGSDRRRRSMHGVQPAASVRDYQIGDSLRYIHWPKSAHRGDLAVKEMELEPSGDVWIVLDLNRQAHSGQGAESTLEYAIVVAASLAAALLDSSEQRVVGLLAASGMASSETLSGAGANQFGDLASDGASSGSSYGGSNREDSLVVLLTPQRGRAQLWRILSALAPVELSSVPLAQLLRQSASALGRRRSMVVVTPDLSGEVGPSKVPDGQAAGGQTTGPINDRVNGEFSDEIEEQAGAIDEVGEDADWAAELLHLQALGLHSSALLITPHVDSPDDILDGSQKPASMPEGRSQRSVEEHAALRALLNRLDVPAELLAVDSTLPPLLTYRRTRQDIVSTPTGGVIVREIEEDVG